MKIRRKAGVKKKPRMFRRKKEVGQNCGGKRRSGLTDVLASLELLVLLAGKHTESVGTEVITLGLEDVGRNDLGPVAVEEGESSGEGGRGDTPEDGLSDDTPPAGLSLVHG